MYNYNTEKEVWKDIKGYEGFYQVSNLGRVKSLERIVIRSDGYKQTRKGKLIKSRDDLRGYLVCGLSKNDKKKYCKVHRLVAEAFIPNPNNYPQINHKDEDKHNNIVNNLEWCTRKYNINYGTAIERAQNHKNSIKAKNKQKIPVIQYDLNGNEIKEYCSLLRAAKDNGLYPYSISYHIDNNTESCGGYKWKRK